MEARPKPRVLVVYYTFSKQTERVADVLARDTRNSVAPTSRRPASSSPTERWAKRFEKVPMRFPIVHIVGMLPAQIRQATGEIRIPPEAQDGDYDLVVIGSPTWWFRVACRSVRTSSRPRARPSSPAQRSLAYTTSRRYWKRNLGDMRRFGEADGGTWVGGTHFVAVGNQVQSMLSWLGFMSGFTYFDNVLRLPPTNLPPGFEAQARQFADTLADRVSARATRADPPSEPA